jgi:DNA-binding XRE family transcriptional regulator
MTQRASLEALRRRRGLSQAALAEAAGVNEWVVVHAEAGGRPRPASALALAEFLGVDVLDLWPLDDEPAGAAA